MAESLGTKRIGERNWAAKAASSFAFVAVSGVLAIAMSSPAAANTIADRINTTNIDKLTGGLAWYALMLCMVGICISGALWALGAKGQNAGTELIGKKGIVVCCTAAFFVGATPGMINWLDDRASEADEAGITSSQPFTGSQMNTITEEPLHGPQP